MACDPSLGGGAALSPLRRPFHDQGIHHGHTIALCVHDNRIEIDFSDVVCVIECDS
jgi:hypothetical protein